MEIVNQARQKPKEKEKEVTLPKNQTDSQRMKIAKLMANPDKPVHIPDRPKEWKPKAAPEFVRDVMGSSAGAGSGEFHVYRHIRRREYNRQAYLEHKDRTSRLDAEFEEKRRADAEAAESKTAKKRAKRQRAKENRKRNAEARKKEKQADDPKTADDDPKSEKDEEEADEVDEGPQIKIGKKK